jgi:quaternary ammonium compound-resistance protein SugE
MPWVILLLSAVLEAVWATALGASDGFTRLIPSLVFAVALVASMAGLGYAAQHIPISTAYAVWTGTGAALTVAWGMYTGAEAITVLRVVFLAGIIIAVIGLKLVRAQPVEPAPPV